MEIKSKHRIVSRAPYMLYMAFVDMRNFVNFLPEDKKSGVEADYDSIKATVQGFNVGVRVKDRVPYSKLSFMDDGAPFKFNVNVHFDSNNGSQDTTDFHIDIDADLNFMMKMLLGSKLQEAVDKVVDGLADLSEGKLPDGIDPSMFPEGFNPSDTGGFVPGSVDPGKDGGRFA